MRFGHFDDSAREYVIAALRSPYPATGCLGSEKCPLPASRRTARYSFHRDARFHRHPGQVRPAPAGSVVRVSVDV